MKNFDIGKELTTIILHNDDITNLIDNKVFPLVANAGTTFPFVVYRRSSFSPRGNKDELSEVVGIDLAVISNTYSQSVNLANLIADTLLAVNDNDVIDYVRIVNMWEDFSEDTYIQKINIDIYLK